MDTDQHQLLLKEEVYAIVGAAMEVSNELGSGFLEAVYQEAMEIEMGQRRIPFVAQEPISISYKGTILSKIYVPDFICFDKVIVELKAIKALTSVEEAQLLNYLKATAKPVGLLINFGSPKLEWKRMVMSKNRR